MRKHSLPNILQAMRFIHVLRAVHVFSGYLLLALLLLACQSVSAQTAENMTDSVPSDADYELVDKCYCVTLHCVEDRKSGRGDSCNITITYGANSEGRLSVKVCDAATGEPSRGIFGDLAIDPGDMAMGKRNNDLRILQRANILQVKNTDRNVSLQFVAQDTRRPRSWNYINLFGFKDEPRATRFTVKSADFYQEKERAVQLMKAGYEPGSHSFSTNLLSYWFFHGLYLFYNTKYAF